MAGNNAGGCLPTPDQETLKKALHFIRYKPRSTGETRERLRRCGYSPDEIERVIDYLEKRSFLDDGAFARTFMEEMRQKELGFRRVREKLLTKRLDRGLVDEVMGEYPLEDEFERAYRVGMARIQRYERDNRASRYRKLRQYLLRRGYSPEVAEQVCGRILRVDTG